LFEIFSTIGFTVIAIVLEPTRPELEVAVKITVLEPDVVGLPEMEAVVETVVRVNPAGRPDAVYETIGSLEDEN
jgi:hypothetical protein